jgi:hypothetical protein
MTKMKKIAVFMILLGLCFCSGCGAFAVLGGETSSEKKIQAEYDLTTVENKSKKILVLVNQPAWLSAGANLSYYVTEAMNMSLAGKVKVVPENLVEYKELSEYRSSKPNFVLLSPVQVGIAFDADIVLLVTIETYMLTPIEETGYYKGSLNANAVLLATADGDKLWPDSQVNKSVKVGFEIGEKDRELCVKRLAGSLAHCTTRYLYNCKRDKFKIMDDKSDIVWEEWGN